MGNLNKELAEINKNNLNKKTPDFVGILPNGVLSEYVKRKCESRNLL